MALAVAAAAVSGRIAISPGAPIVGRAIPVLPFASCYVYSPDGRGAACERSRLLCALIKAGDSRFMRRYALRVRQQFAPGALDASPVGGFFGSDFVLVPIPRSVPSRDVCPSVPERLATALTDAGVGGGIWHGLRRARRVRKSATAPPGARPTVGIHYESLAVEPPGSVPAKVLLVDDVVSRGRTLLAAAARLHDARPGIEIRAFALLRTLGFAARLPRLLEPCIGEIRWRAGDAHRSP